MSLQVLRLGNKEVLGQVFPCSLGRGLSGAGIPAAAVTRSPNNMAK